MPRQMRRAALRSALSAKAADKQIVVLDALTLDAPKTRAVANLLNNLDIHASALILLAEGNTIVERSIRNLEGVQYLRAQYLNVRDLLKAGTLVVPRNALEVIENWLG
jgi:large subunit ribosomal protein L4